MQSEEGINHYIREETLFASVRMTIQNRAEIYPKINILKDTCSGVISGPLMLMFHYDTPVDGFDAEFGFPVSEEINIDPISTRPLVYNEYFSMIHIGPTNTIKEAYGKLYPFMYKKGISAGMDTMELMHEFYPESPEKNKTEVCAAIHMWTRLYKIALNKVLGKELQEKIFEGGEKITPFTSIEKRTAWVATTLNRLKEHSDDVQQYQILSNIALTRPLSEINQYAEIYQKTHNIGEVMALVKKKQNWLIEPRVEGSTVYTSKVPRDRKRYDQAKTFDEKRAHYCFCRLVADNPTTPPIDPIFCYRAAGWAAQMYERVVGQKVQSCDIIQSILKGDSLCEFALHFPNPI